MKIKAFIILGILLIFSICLICQEKLFRNAYDWEKYDLKEKVFFLVGLNQGSFAEDFSYRQVLLLKYQWQKDKMEELITLKTKSYFFIDIGGANNEQIIAGIDELYKDYANKNIPIFAVATLVTKRITGKIKTEDVEKELSKLRTAKWE